jgi:alpha-ketoglutarate-dependent taurine dioxygenase
LAVKRKKKKGSHLFKRGALNPRAQGKGGRKKGTPNKFTKAIKDQILQALEELGGVRYLKYLATRDKRAFAGLVGRVMPYQVEQAAPEETADKIRAHLAEMDQRTVTVKGK